MRSVALTPRLLARAWVMAPDESAALAALGSAPVASCAKEIVAMVSVITGASSVMLPLSALDRELANAVALRFSQLRLAALLLTLLWKMSVIL